jgi:phage terminase large subunit
MSKVIDLTQCFPLGEDGKRGPLPKQREFLDAVLGQQKRYVRYSGGIGSGKTMIGCIAVIHMAVLKQGDYLIGRQFLPELKSTTYKNFLEICPPELVAEIRVADMEVKLWNVEGGKSTIYFRGLEDPDKLRSLNLCAVYVDEAAQVSEGAFMLLQGRLRGKHWRKLIITQNPGGHDWAWKWFVQQNHITDQKIKNLFLNIRAPSTENIHLPEGYVETMMASWSPERIKREIEGSDDVFAGQIYNEFARHVHVIKPFRIPDDWVRRIGIDHGYRNEAAWAYSAIDPDGDVYIYREYYQKEKLIKEICEENKKLWGANEVFEQARIDPSTRAARGNTGKSDWDTYLEHLPSTFPLMLANNEVRQGIDRMKSYLKPDKRGRPRLFIFDTCENLIDEIGQYRWKEQPTSQEGRANLKEEPVKHHDHLLDATRYMIMTCPEPTPKIEDPAERNRRGTLERTLFDELREIKKPSKIKDPFGD